jgi:signal peptidase complex subunit 1
MDFKGQEYAEKLGQKLLVSVAVISFIVGYVKGDFGVMMSLFGVGFLFVFVLTVPNWPMYNKHPIAWVKGKKKGKSSGSTLLASVKKIFE